MTTHVLLLRGINVGGNKKVPMADLKKMLTKMGYENVTTLLNSGNATFDAPKADAKELEKVLEKTFGFSIPVILRTKADLEKIAAKNPFKGVKVTKDVRLYVTFLGDGAKKPPMKIPYASEDGSFRILSASKSEVFSVLDLSKGMGTVDAMSALEKEWSKNVTTRNWNTVEKLLKGASTEQA